MAEPNIGLLTLSNSPVKREPARLGLWNRHGTLLDAALIGPGWAAPHSPSPAAQLWKPDRGNKFPKHQVRILLGVLFCGATAAPIAPEKGLAAAMVGAKVTTSHGEGGWAMTYDVNDTLISNQHLRIKRQR